MAPSTSDVYREPPRPNGLPISQPNMIMFMPDQLRYDSLGCTGNPMVKTPNIDAFAARALHTKSFAKQIHTLEEETADLKFWKASVCTQSRISMFTGKYLHTSGHRNFDNLLKPHEPNMFRSLKEGGYHVACLAPRGDLFGPEVVELSVNEYGFIVNPDNMPGNWKSGGQAIPEDPHNIWHRLFYKGRRDVSQAFDYDEGAVRSAEAWLADPPEGPWCLFIPLMFPHCPFWVEEPYFSMYDRAAVPRPAKLADKTGHEPAYMAAIRSEYGTARATDEMWAEVAATYFGMITRLDDQFGRIISILDSTGLFSKTVTMFFSDHGEYLGDYGLIEKWPSGLSDSLVHEPLILAGAGLPVGKVVDEMAEMVDLTPTLLHLGSVGETFAHNGKSLLPTILESRPHREFSYSEGGFLLAEEPLLEIPKWPYDLKAGLQHTQTKVIGKAISMRDKEWTFIWRLYESCELYSRRDDPKEVHNVAAEPQYANIVRSRESTMFRWLAETSDVLPWKRDPRFATSKLATPAEQLEARKRRQPQ
ncbi:putative Sulfatase [Seiridium cardinale]|uniref:Sulfatase n=1 Tax=Seiridium cardinale TaxID=138064 RepID=A0ABR2Y0T2_9PEZI